MDERSETEGWKRNSDPAVMTLAAELPLLRLRFLLAPASPFEPPPFPGSMFRGALGHALLDVACRRSHRRCAGCDLLRSCAYPTVFEPVRRQAGERGAGPVTPPVGFVPEWEPLPRRVEAPYPLDLLLIGAAVPHAEAVTRAVDRMAATGLGEARCPHRLLDGRAIRPNGRLASPASGAEPLASHLGPLPDAHRLRVALRTPLRVKDRGAFVRRLEFHHLLFAADRRLRLLHAAANERGSGPSLPSAGDGSRASIERSRTTWTELSRRSNRQDRQIPIDGLTGSLVLRSETGDWPLLLSVAEVLHLGKGTAHGLGRMDLEEVE